MAINVSVYSITVVFSPTLYHTVDPRLLPSDSPFKCHENVFVFVAYETTISST